MSSVQTASAPAHLADPFSRFATGTGPQLGLRAGRAKIWHHAKCQPLMHCHGGIRTDSLRVRKHHSCRAELIELRLQPGALPRGGTLEALTSWKCTRLLGHPSRVNDA